MLRGRRYVPSLPRWWQRAVALGSAMPRAVISYRRARARPPADGLPVAPRRLRQASEVALDEFLITAQSAFRAVPQEREMAASVDRLAVVGQILADHAPGDLHRTPPPLSPSSLEPTRWMRSNFETLTWPSPPALPDVLRVAAPWVTQPETATVCARIMRHPGAPRPWVICVHGAEQGLSHDVVAFRAKHLHVGLGLNVAMPVLPLHGPRKVKGSEAPGFDVATNVAFGILGVAEIRQLIRWIRSDVDQPVGIYGVSLGGYMVSLLAGVEDDIDLVIAGIPVVSMQRLLARHLVRSGGREGRVLASLLRSDPVHSVERFVDPLAFTPAVALERRFVFGGLTDRVTTPQHTLALWRHWDEPSVVWYPGGHIGHFWAGDVRAFVDGALSQLTEGSHTVSAASSSFVT